MKRLKLSNGGHTLVDEEWYEMLSKLCWRKRRARKDSSWYVVTTIDSTTYNLHRIICETDCIVDHINGDSLDNRSSNLRSATYHQNRLNSNKMRNCKHSKYKGVTKTTSGRWYVRATLNGKRIGLGAYDTEEEAGRKYDEFIKENYGDFANFNFPN